MQWERKCMCLCVCEHVFARERRQLPEFCSPVLSRAICIFLRVSCWLLENTASCLLSWCHKLKLSFFGKYSGFTKTVTFASFSKETVGEPFYLLVTTLNQKINKGPVDVITCKALYTLNEDWLLWQVPEFSTVVSLQWSWWVDSVCGGGGECHLKWCHDYCEAQTFS